MTSITVALSGGLGNQLFQYAFGRALALKLGMGLKLNSTEFNFDKRFKRSLEIGAFRLAQLETVTHSTFDFQTTRLMRHLKVSSLYVPMMGRYLAEPFGQYSTFNSKLFNVSTKEEIFLAGYWQNEMYFKEIKPLLLKEFSLQADFSAKNQELSRKIIDTPQSVAIHFRRVDYPTVDFSYYERAITYLKSRLTKPVFYLFSDDPGWVKKNIAHIDLSSTILELDRGPNYEDIALMAQCKHHIIANSSFSWWGAWLSSGNPNIIIAPESAPLTPSIPSDWIKI